MIKPLALSLVTAARLPKIGTATGPGVFDRLGDVVIDCDKCGWHAMGTRPLMKEALAEHQRMYHALELGPFVTRLNTPSQ